MNESRMLLNCELNHARGDPYRSFSPNTHTQNNSVLVDSHEWKLAEATNWGNKEWTEQKIWKNDFIPLERHAKGRWCRRELNSVDIFATLSGGKVENWARGGTGGKLFQSWTSSTYKVADRLNKSILL